MCQRSDYTVYPRLVMSFHFVDWLMAVAGEFLEISPGNLLLCRSQWPRGLRRRTLAARLLRLWV